MSAESWLATRIPAFGSHPSIYTAAVYIFLYT
jgi:hypothetical protein